MSSSSPHLSTRRSLLGGALGSASLAVGASQLVAAAPNGWASENGPWLATEVPGAFRAAPKMAAATRAFLESLDAKLRAKALYHKLGDSARTEWSNFPAGASPRPGIAIGDLSDVQRVRLHDLLCASTSSQGYHKMTGAIRADQVLHDLQGGDALFGAADYYVAVFGSPQDAQWAWMLTGHHMSAIFTVFGDRTAFTPMFTGAQPLQIATGLEAGWRVLPKDANRASELFASLSADQRSIAVTSLSAPFDVFAGPGRQASLSTFSGIPAEQLGDGQQRLLWLLVEEFVGNAESDAAAAHLALVRQHWRDTHFAWQGPAPDSTARYYFRVHGPRLLIEYDVQEPLSSNGGHVHAITRDPVNDYGMDWLGLHYHESEHAPGPGGPGGPLGGPHGPGGPAGPGHRPAPTSPPQ